MDEHIENAVEELKRVDHSIFVSLKYTRTVDVLVNIIIRMVDCYEQLFLALLNYALHHKLCSSIPSTPKERGMLIKEIFHEQEIHDNIDLYFLLKALMKSNYGRENEYRRHVAMRAIISGREEIVNINIISRYYEFLTSFFHLVDSIRKNTYVVGSGILTNSPSTQPDEENPSNPYWDQVKRMKEEADVEIAHEKEIRERIRLDKQNKDMERQKQMRAAQIKLKRITKRKPKIKPKKIISQEKLKLQELKNLAKKRIEKEQKQNIKKNKSKK
jgi:hypothetical protein